MNLPQRKFTAALALFAAASAALAQPATQTTTATPAQDEPQVLERFEVTGSYIPQAAGALASPVTTLDPDLLDKSFVTTNPLEALRKTVPQFHGNANLGSSNANIGSGSTGGGSQASLRNLNTLTLINSRRAAVSPISGTGGFQFVDMNIIPMAAIDSIDILLDGASATYGSDATSGVINIRSKRNFSGAQIGGFYEFAPKDGRTWENRGGTFVFGTGSGNTNITVAGGYARQDPLWQYERDFSAVSYGTPTFGGVINIGSNYFVLNPELSTPPVGTTKPSVAFPMATSAVPAAPGGRPYFGAVGSNAVYWGKVSGGNVAGFGSGELAGATTADAAQVAFNLSEYVTLLQKRESRGAMVTWDHRVNDAATFFGDILVSKIDTFSQINAQPVGTTPDFNVTGAHPNNPFNTTLRVRNRFVNNPRQYTYNTNFGRIVGGVRGDINERVSYETAVNLNKSELQYRNSGVIDSAGLLAAAGIVPAATSASGIPINMFQRSIPASAVASANFIGTAYNNFDSVLNSWDGRVIAKAFQLQGNDVTFAFGGEYRKEELSGDADLNSIPDADGNIGWTGATSVNPFSASRTVTAGFVELLAPIFTPKNNVGGFHTLELSAAVRHERYSDTDDPTVPKISLRWLPFNDEFAFRATYGESFNAPTLYQVFGPSDVGFTNPVNLLPNGAADQPGNYVEGQAQIRGGSNPTLKPATSEAYTAGIVWSPKGIKGFSAELGYYNIKEKDVVSVVSEQTILQSVENLGPNSPYVRNLANGQPNPAYIGNRDSAVSYDVRIEGFGDAGQLITAPGQVASNIDIIYMNRPLVNLATQSTDGFDLSLKYKYDWAGVAKFDIVSNSTYTRSYEIDGEQVGGRATLTAGTIPRWGNYTYISARRGPIEFSVGNRYIPKTFAPDETSGKTHAEAYNTMDVGIGFQFGETGPRFFRGLKVSLAVTNVTDEKLPLLPDTFSEANADTATYDPLGRRYLIKADYKF